VEELQLSLAAKGAPLMSATARVHKLTGAGSSGPEQERVDYV